ncbi:MAG: hypothetical protein JSW44_02640 [Candidatus Bathyarchaeota archaeon]|nr:MAG: hypothetical protein JSW44_02640 [Candidatus Bathyarchaeota archaeon]
MVTVVGWDIGGANTKVAYVRTRNSFVEELKTTMEYFPIWKDSNKLESVLLTLKEKLSGTARLECMGLTMTAELSDAYQTKREGVNHVLTSAAQAFADVPVFVLDVNAKLRSIESAK